MPSSRSRRRGPSGSRRRLAAAALAAAALACTLGSPPAGAAEPSWSPVALQDSLQRDLVSAINGRTYRLFLYAPDAPPPAAGFPVVYLLDGAAHFPLLAQLARLSASRSGRSGVAPCVVVGIDHAPGSREAVGDPLAARFSDLTPAAPAGSLPPRPGGGAWPASGGAARFAEVLQREIKPLVAARLPLDSARETLVGHSLGGLFALHSLFTRGAGFERYVAGSPSIWFGGGLVLEEAESFLAGRGDGPRPELLITVGGAETSAGPGQPPAERPEEAMANRAEALAARLAERPDRLASRFVRFAGESHLSVVPAMLSRALRFACRAD